jgi:hypothetical protein
MGIFLAKLFSWDFLPHGTVICGGRRALASHPTPIISITARSDDNTRERYTGAAV